MFSSLRTSANTCFQQLAIKLDDSTWNNARACMTCLRDRFAGFFAMSRYRAQYEELLLPWLVQTQHVCSMSLELAKWEAQGCWSESTRSRTYQAKCSIWKCVTSARVQNASVRIQNWYRTLKLKFSHDSRLRHLCDINNTLDMYDSLDFGTR